MTLDKTALEVAKQCSNNYYANPESADWDKYIENIITAYLSAIGVEPVWAVEDEYGFVEVYSTEARAQKAAERLSSVGEVYPLYAAPAKPGYVLVPEVPTDAMLSAVWSMHASNGRNIAEVIYAAMLAAAKDAPIRLKAEAAA